MIKELISKCKYGVYLSVNPHRDYYETVEDYFKPRFKDYIDEIEPKVYQKMKETDIIIELQFYPRTPVSSYIIWHYDLDSILKNGLEILNS